MLAYDINSTHVGQDITFTVDGTYVGGIIRSTRTVAGMITLDVDGQEFVLDEEKDVTVREVDLDRLIIMETDSGLRENLRETKKILARTRAQEYALSVA